MSLKNFKVLEERRLSALSPDQLKVWSKLVARREKLEFTQMLLEEEEELFVDSVLDGVTQENHGAVRGIRLTNDGLLLQTYCTCYRCQAQLQHLPPTQVVEAMVKQELIAPEDVASARKWAAEEEQRRGRPLLS